MVPFIKVQVEKVLPNHLVLSLPNGETLLWPMESIDDSNSALVPGMELVLTLTHSTRIINELLSDTHGKNQKENNK
ncbi:MAG TPA: hypothetical protein VJB65_03880 [Patescibacteria group bacterium]|nr:hypothetical protein [Patescibacteria group bacterium]